MKRNKGVNRGFTLIELLAVIVILAVIALIATPIIIGIIEDSRKSAFKSSLYGIFDATDYKLLQDKNTQFPASGIEVPSLSMNNNKFTSGTVYQDEQGMYLKNVGDGKYCGNGYKDKLEVTKGSCFTDEKWFTFDDNTGTITLYSMDGPKEVVIPNKIRGVEVKHIEGWSFSGIAITKVVIPDTIISIEEGSFSYAYTIEEVVLPDSVTSIGGWAFAGNLLTNINIPDSVTTIGEGAFSENQLTNITIPDSVTTIGGGAFTNNKLPDSDAFIYNRNSDGTEDKTHLNSYGGTNRDNVVIPNEIKKISDYSFMGSQITNIVIPNGVTTIGNGAFRSNKLTSVTIPDSVTSIKNFAFYQNQLTSVKIIGKSSSTDFTIYGTSPWGWATGYNDSNIIWNATE